MIREKRYEANPESASVIPELGKRRSVETTGSPISRLRSKIARERLKIQHITAPVYEKSKAAVKRKLGEEEEEGEKGEDEVGGKGGKGGGGGEGGRGGGGGGRGGRGGEGVGGRRGGEEEEGGGREQEPNMDSQEIPFL